MAFWIITGALALAVTAIMALAVRSARHDGTASSAAYDLRVYRDQLREVDRDLARGVVSEGDAERARTEISRRILAADASAQSAGQPKGEAAAGPWAFAGFLAVGIIGAAFGLYLQLGAPGYGDLALKDRIEMSEALRTDRPSQADAEASLPPLQTPTEASPDYVSLVEQLRSTVAGRPDDLQGHILLAQNEANLGNFPAAARAQGQVLRIKGEAATVADLTDYADMLVLAAGGYVSPEAEGVLRAALSRDPENGTARYYLGLMMAQTGRPDIAFRAWDQLLRAGPPDAPWIRPVLAQIEDIAMRAGVNYQPPEIGTARGPSQADMEAAADMTPAERMEMISGMVAGLSDRLATEGGPVEDWVQLISALGVLGQQTQARAVYDNAVEVFAGDTRALDLLLRAGQRAQVVE